jgi:negative regulator of flagellin synthesis FlgM
MRIDGRTEQLAKLRQKGLDALNHAEPTRDCTREIRRTDRVTLSSRAQEIHRLYQALSAAPPERAERVASLRRAVENGSYVIPEDALAERLLGVVYPER